MFLDELVYNLEAELKLGARGITIAEVEQMRSNGPVVSTNPHPRVEGSRFLIGPTHGMRFLTVVIQPDALRKDVWHVMTAWESKEQEIRAWQSRQRGGT